jgi:mono/diheme cytochrome c family protein
MKKIFSRATLSGLLLAGMVACTHEESLSPAATNNQGNNTGGNGGGNNSGGICFQTQVLPLLQTHCAKSGCHDAATAEEDIVLDSYANIMASDDAVEPGNLRKSKIYEYITHTDPDKKMPPAPYPALNSGQVAIIAAWIEQGAQNTTNCGNGPCDSTVFTFAAEIQPIVQNNCVGCHSGTTPSGGHNFTTHSGLQAVALSGKLLAAVTHAAGAVPMPYNAAKLSDCNIAKIRQWVQSGAPNN